MFRIPRSDVLLFLTGGRMSGNALRCSSILNRLYSSFSCPCFKVLGLLTLTQQVRVFPRVVFLTLLFSRLPFCVLYWPGYCSTASFPDVSWVGVNQDQEIESCNGTPVSPEIHDQHRYKRNAPFDHGLPTSVPDTSKKCPDEL